MEHYVNYQCNVNFDYSAHGIPNLIKNFVESEFMKARNEAIELLNPHYEEWNEAYTDPVEDEFDKKYNSYICSKQNAILDEFNKTWMGPVKLYSDEETCAIRGKFKIFGKTVTMGMTIEIL